MGEAETNDDVIVIPPKRTVFAICYHIVDEQIASNIDKRSIKATLRRIAANPPIQVSRKLWRQLGNMARLRLLQQQSRTFIGFDNGGAAVLTPMESRKKAHGDDEQAD